MAGIIIAFAARSVKSLEDFPIFNRVVDTIVIQEILRQYELQQADLDAMQEFQN